MASEYQHVTLPPGMETRTVRRMSDGAFIPFDEGNRDYREYLAWVAKGNKADPAPPPAPAPLPG